MRGETVKFNSGYVLLPCLFYLYLHLSWDSFVDACCRALGLYRNIAPHGGCDVILSIIYYYV